MDKIIIPFSAMGDKGWTGNTNKIVEETYDYRDTEPYQPVSLSVIENLERKLKAKLPDGLKLFYEIIGVPLEDMGEIFCKIADIDFLSNKVPLSEHCLTKEERRPAMKLIALGDCLRQGNMMCFH